MLLSPIVSVILGFFFSYIQQKNLMANVKERVKF